MLNGSVSRWLQYRLGWRPADTQTTADERGCLTKYAAGKGNLIDGDHPWGGIDHDWRGWSRHVVHRRVVALHGSRSVPGRPDLDCVRYTCEVILIDPGFRLIDAVESLTVLECVEDGSPR
jgi:hypothetical protein